MQFQPNIPFASPNPTIVVDAGLAPGDHRFRLVVFNERGQQSAPVEFTVSVIRRIIIDPTRPTPGPVVVDPRPVRPIPVPPTPVERPTRRPRRNPTQPPS
jgi:hypothetical protein